MSSTSTEFIDVTTTIYSGVVLSKPQYVADKNQVLLYMPDLDYKGLHEAEQLADERGLKLIVIPVTLPVMDIVMQAEHAGLAVTKEFVAAVRSGVRDLVTKVLNEEGIKVAERGTLLRPDSFDGC